MSKQWFVVHTQPNKEKIALVNLQQQNFEAFLPVYEKSRRHARKVDTVQRPLFPGYLFVAFDLHIDRWRSINGTRGVSYLLCTEDTKPLPVPKDIIENLQTEQASKGHVSLKALTSFMVGDKARLLEGPFSDEIVVFNQMTDQDRAQILVHFMGRSLKVEVPLTSLEKMD